MTIASLDLFMDYIVVDLIIGMKLFIYGTNCECTNIDSLMHAKCLCLFLFDHFKEWSLDIAIH